MFDYETDGKLYDIILAIFNPSYQLDMITNSYKFKGFKQLNTNLEGIYHSVKLLRMFS